jgi:3-phosphoshikimate 1-carboxyvinyltransferase
LEDFGGKGMSDTIEIQPAAGPIHASIRPPGSKSITNRALICAALAEGESRLEGALQSDDTRVMIDSLIRLGVYIEPAGWQGNYIGVSGSSGKIPAANADLFVGNSGTTIRFLTPTVALGNGTFRLDGVPRMRQRPIGDLLTSLRKLGVDARSERGNDCPPVIVNAQGLPGGKVQVRGDVSSQFLSGLLLASPGAKSPVEIEVVGELVSQPYVAMTVAVMKEFGVEVAAEEMAKFTVAAQCTYQARRYAIEPDASAASYFWAAAAITGGRVTVQGLSKNALQGDVAFCDCLAQMGCEVQYDTNETTVMGPPGGLTGIDVNMNAISDTVQTLATVALFADGPTTIRGVAHNRFKETDRIGNLAIELRKLGARVEELDDGLRIVPGTPHGAAIDTYDDHRMAMSLALAGLKIPGVVIHDPGCTAKTYPGYWHDLASLVPQ